MEPKASYLIVGSFVIIIAIALLAVIVWLADAQIARDNRNYAIYFDGSVTGLVRGSPVRYRGVPFGRVTSITLDPDNIERIKIVIETPTEPRIRADATARLESQGVTGASFIQIVGGTQDAPPAPIPDGETMPVIPSQGSSFSELLSQAPLLLDNLIALSEQAQTLLSAENQQAVADILNNTEAITANLNDGAEQLTETMDGINALVTDLQALTVGLNSVIADDVPLLRDRVDETLVSFQQTAEAFERSSGELEAMIAENRAPISDFTQDGLYELSVLLGDLRQLTRTLDSVSSRLERDASGFLFRGNARGITLE